MTGKPGAESADAEEIQKLLSEVAKDLETDAQRGIEELQKDKALYDKLKEMQSKQEKQKHGLNAFVFCINLFTRDI